MSSVYDKERELRGLTNPLNKVIGLTRKEIRAIMKEWREKNNLNKKV